MPEIWCPGAIRLPDVPERAFTIRLKQDNATHRIHDWHTFESKGYKMTALAGGRYLNSTGKWGHFVWNPVLGGLVQLLPMNVAGWLLRAQDVDGDGDLEHTNGWGEVHAGTEVIGDAYRPFHLDMTREGQDDLIILMNFLRSWNIPDRWAWPLQPPPAYPNGSVRRRNPEQSGHAYHSGYLGNDHGDPGQILAPWVMEKISITTPPPPPPPVEEPPMVTVLKYPPKSQIKTDAFWVQLERVLLQEGWTEYCGPQYVKSGACRPGNHGHWEKSRHWVARAFDAGRDPSSGAPISAYEKTHLSALALRLRDLYGTAMGMILDRANDHKDHLHLDDGQSGFQVTFTNDYSAIGDELVYGRTGSKVLDWQKTLVVAGYPTATDGSFGPDVFDKTKALQAAMGLRPDGIVGNATQAAAKKAVDSLKPVGPDYSDFTAEQIKAAQTALKSAGWYVGTNTDIDGLPGPNFQKAMKVAQETLKREGLYTGDIDLLPGPKFMTAIRAYLAPPKEEPVPTDPIIIKPEPTPDPVLPTPVDPTPPPGVRVKVSRLSGRSRYDTSALLDAQRKTYYNPAKVYLAATGTDDLILAGGDGRVMSTSPTMLPTEIRQRLEAIEVEELVIVGGTAAISDEVFQAAAKAAAVTP